jgi:hypothetical protein
MPPNLIPFREYARVHVSAARALLAGDGPQLRYACLEIRLAIEALAYAVFQNYLEDDKDRILSHQDADAFGTIGADATKFRVPKHGASRQKQAEPRRG